MLSQGVGQSCAEHLGVQSVWESPMGNHRRPLCRSNASCGCPPAKPSESNMVCWYTGAPCLLLHSLRHKTVARGKFEDNLKFGITLLITPLGDWLEDYNQPSGRASACGSCQRQGPSGWGQDPEHTYTWDLLPKTPWLPQRPLAPAQGCSLYLEHTSTLSISRMNNTLLHVSRMNNT